MTVSRREVLRWGAIGAGGVMMSSAASSVGIDPLTFRTPPATPGAPLTAVPATVAAPMGVPAELYARAKAALDMHGAAIRHRDIIGIVDFSAGSHLPRFHVVHLASGYVESHLVAHGRGSDPEHTGYLERFSNRVGSEASSNGAYATADLYHGKYGLSMKVHGLDWSNNNAEARAIVIHNAWYAEPDMIAQHGKLGRSEGCFAFSRRSQWDVMHRLGDGRLIYADKLA